MKTFIIGRNPNASSGEIPIKINDQTHKVSSNHCRIIFDGNQYFIEDLISTNGTFVDGVKINGKTLVNKSSKISLGEKMLFSLFELDAYLFADLYQPAKTEQFVKEQQYHNQNAVNQSEATNNIFFHFIEPLLHSIDNGNFFKKPVYWFYIILGGFFLLLPFVILIVAIKFSDFLDGKMIFGLVLFFLVMLFAGWIVFQILWNRKENLAVAEHSNSIYAISILAHNVKTLGEVLGFYVAIVGFGLALITSLFLNDNNNIFGDELAFIGLKGIILFPILGFSIVLISSYLSETIRVLAEIALNTSKKKN